ncbi:MAG: tetratricopeptide repeat protein [Calothrix sp. MO_167.B12]|nr:tetratricopeptide repeat protein [Calothrix sp. MO_167.B12]
MNLTTVNQVKTIITEEHSSQLHLWHKLGWRHATVIYFDAHLDLQYISQDRINSLLKCQTNEELIQLEKPYHTVPDKGYSYSIEDFLFAAHRLGLIDHVIWVCPTPEKGRQNPMDTIRMLKNMEGFRMEDFTSFEIVGNTVKSKLLGLDVTICGYQDLADLELTINTKIDIDIDYFIALPQDSPWIDPKEVFKTLQKLPIEYDHVTFTRSVSSGYMPLRYHFIADYMAALWRNDIPLAEHYSRLFALDSKAQQGEVEAARFGCLEELTKFPKCAATYYLLSLLLSDGEKAFEYQSNAANLCPSYRPSILRDANAIISRDLKYDKTMLEKLEQQLQDHESDDNERLLTHFTFGLLYSNLGDKESTFKHYQACQEIKAGCYPQLSLALAGMSLNSEDEEQAISLLEKALLDESTKPEAHTLLGSIYLKKSNYDLARKHLSQATEMLPSAKKPLKLLAELYQKIGDDKNYRIQMHKYHQIQFFIR